MPVYYGLHRHEERVPALLHRLYVALRLVHLLLGVEQSLFLLAVHVLLVGAVGVYHVGERWRYLQVGYAPVVDGEGHVAVVVGVHDEVGRYLLQASAFRLAKGGARLGV